MPVRTGHDADWRQPRGLYHRVGKCNRTPASHPAQNLIHIFSKQGVGYKDGWRKQAVRLVVGLTQTPTGLASHIDSL